MIEADLMARRLLKSCQSSAHLYGLLGGHSIGGFMDEVSCMESNDVHSQDLACVLAVDHLGHAVSLLLSQSLQESDITQCFCASLTQNLAQDASGISRTMPRRELQP